MKTTTKVPCQFTEKCLTITGTMVCVIVLFASCAQATAITYSYDSLGQLSRVDYGGNRSITYTYDDSKQGIP
jgi:hypothetical protein